MRKKYIFMCSALAMAFYFMFPQTTSDSIVAEAATVQATESAVIETEMEKQKTKTNPNSVEESKILYREGLTAYITTVNKTVTTDDAKEMVDCMIEQAEKYQLDEKLIMAVAQTESTYYSDAVSYTDYKGLMQTGDILAEEAGYAPADLFDPKISIEIGADYMNMQMETFDSDVVLALTAYNQGPGSIYEGAYSTDYAEQTLAHMENIEFFLHENGYLE